MPTYMYLAFTSRRLISDLETGFHFSEFAVFANLVFTLLVSARAPMKIKTNISINEDGDFQKTVVSVGCYKEALMMERVQGKNFGSGKKEQRRISFIVQRY